MLMEITRRSRPSRFRYALLKTVSNFNKACRRSQFDRVVRTSSFATILIAHGTAVTSTAEEAILLPSAAMAAAKSVSRRRPSVTRFIVGPEQWRDDHL